MKQPPPQLAARKDGDQVRL